MTKVKKLLLVLTYSFYSTISFNINTIGDGNVVFDSNAVLGRHGDGYIEHIGMGSFTHDHTYLTRKFDKDTKLSLPPFSKIDVGYYWQNFNEDIVDLQTVRVPLSRENLSRGDITELLYENQEQPFGEGKTCSSTICKGGKYVDIEGLGLLESNISPYNRKGGIHLETFTMKPAVELDRWEVEFWGNGGFSQVTLYIKNNVNEYLDNIEIMYREGGLTRVRDLEPNTILKTVVYIRCNMQDGDIDCGRLKFTDHNTKTHCMGYGSDWGMFNNHDSVSVFSLVNNEWFSGAQIQPSMESFCIQRLPYSYYTDELTIELEPEEPLITQEGYWKTALGMNILPITNTLNSRFQRLLKPYLPVNLNIYESFNIHTGLRTKNS